MSNSEWQKYMKTKYLDLAHAMQKKGRPNNELGRLKTVRDIAKYISQLDS